MKSFYSPQRRQNYEAGDLQVVSKAADEALFWQVTAVVNHAEAIEILAEASISDVEVPFQVGVGQRAAAGRKRRWLLEGRVEGPICGYVGSLDGDVVLDRDEARGKWVMTVELDRFYVTDDVLAPVQSQLLTGRSVYQAMVGYRVVAELRLAGGAPSQVLRIDCGGQRVTSVESGFENVLGIEVAARGAELSREDDIADIPRLYGPREAPLPVPCPEWLAAGLAAVVDGERATAVLDCALVDRYGVIVGHRSGFLWRRGAEAGRTVAYELLERSAVEMLHPYRARGAEVILSQSLDGAAWSVAGLKLLLSISWTNDRFARRDKAQTFALALADFAAPMRLDASSGFPGRI